MQSLGHNTTSLDLKMNYFMFLVLPEYHIMFEPLVVVLLVTTVSTCAAQCGQSPEQAVSKRTQHAHDTLQAAGS